MKIRTPKSFPWLAGVLLAVTCAAALASPFVGTRSVPHAVLYLNVSEKARQIWPVEIWAVDGHLTNRSKQGVLWIKPGRYAFKVRVSGTVNLADLPGLQRSARYQQTEHVLHMTVVSGRAYYIGAKFDAAGKWRPQVWKTEKTSH